MQMELLKKPVKSYRTIDIRETEEMLENNIIVPDSKPDIKDILLADAECFVNNVEKSGRMVEISGEIKYRILYRSDTPDNRMDCIVTAYPWSFSLQMPKSEGEIGITARCRCQHTEASVVNGRKVVSRTVTSLVCRFSEIRTHEIGREILGENVYLKTTPINVITLRDSGNIVARVSNILLLPHGSPAIKEVLFTRMNIGYAELSYREEEPCLEAKGMINILYRSDSMDESIESVVLEFPIKTSTGVQAGADASVLTMSTVKNWELDVLEDNDGLNTQVAINMDIEIDAQAVLQEEQIIIEDSYSTDCQLVLNKSKMDFVTDERELCDSHEITQRVRIEVTEGHLDEVYMVCANERNIASMVTDRSINVQGTAGIDILFCTGNREILSHSIELPFTQVFGLPDDGRWQVVQSCFYIEDVSFDISGGDAIELCVQIKVKLRLAKHEEMVCADGLSVIRDDFPKKAPIILYFAQPTDTLWSIAKNYRIPLSRLAVDNGIDASAKLETGRRLFIMS